MEKFEKSIKNKLSRGERRQREKHFEEMRTIRQREELEQEVEKCKENSHICHSGSYDSCSLCDLPSAVQNLRKFERIESNKAKRSLRKSAGKEQSRQRSDKH
eukprot:GILI01010119.1.p1 GENE.GILI01010119.1~~GILI01010119.1.p1  ORF type:complete len:102 (-),score=19.25 GILI01010119.1:160-465(-)